MKFTTAIYTIILAVTYVQAAAIAEPFCHRPGEPCPKALRARDAEAFCHRPGMNFPLIEVTCVHI